MYSVFLLIWNRDAAKIFWQILQHFSFVWLFTVYWRHFYIIHVWFRLSRRSQNNSLIHASGKCVCLQNYVNQSRHPALLLSLLLLLFVAESTKQRKGDVTWYIILLKWIFYENVCFCTRKICWFNFECSTWKTESSSTWITSIKNQIKKNVLFSFFTHSLIFVAKMPAPSLVILKPRSHYGTILIARKNNFAMAQYIQHYENSNIHLNYKPNINEWNNMRHLPLRFVTSNSLSLAYLNFRAGYTLYAHQIWKNTITNLSDQPSGNVTAPIKFINTILTSHRPKVGYYNSV